MKPFLESFRQHRSRYRLRRGEDASGVLFSAGVWACYLVAWLFTLHPSWIGVHDHGSAMAYVLGTGFLLGLAAGANLAFNLHNHHHNPFFGDSRVNLWFGRLTALSAGWPALLWSHTHTLHHAKRFQADDWTAPRKRRDGQTESLPAFLLLGWPARVLRGLKSELESGRIGPGKTVRHELRLFAVLWAVPFLLDPWLALGLWVLPHAIANLVMAAILYVQHYGCSPAQERESLTTANSFESPVFDLLCFHAGHASVHYAWPEAHWSELPQLHARLHSRMVDEGTHVLPYGPFQAAEVLGGFVKHGEAREEFERTQARDYGTPGGLRHAAHHTDETEPRPLSRPVQVPGRDERAA